LLLHQLNCFNFSDTSALNALNSSFRSLNSCLNESRSSPPPLLLLATLKVVVLGAGTLIVPVDGDPKFGSGGGGPLGVPGASGISLPGDGGGGAEATAIFLANFFLQF